MDLTGKAAIARFAIGDKVRLEHGGTWVVVGRFYRRSTQQIVYEIQDPFSKYITRRAEVLLRRAEQ